MTGAVGSMGPAGRLTPSRWMTWPAVIYLVLMTQAPFVVTLYLSLHAWNLLYPARGVRFVGIGNYRTLILDHVFQLAILNTAVFTVVTVFVTAALGLVLALLLDRMTWGRGFAYTLLLAPFLIMETVSPIIFKNMIYHPIYGLLNWALGLVGLGPLDLVGAHPSVTILSIVSWQWMPFMMLVLLTGLQSLPRMQWEAAALDGANSYQRFWYITLPHLQPFFAVGMLLETILLLPMFGPIYVTTYGGPGYSTQNLTFSVFRLLSQQYEVGKAAAGGVLTAAITIVVTILLLRALRPTMERR